MSLRDVLTQIVEDNSSILLSDGNKDWEAGSLLESLPEHRLKRAAHLQSGLYIAAVDEGGYLGEVLYRVKQKA